MSAQLARVAAAVELAAVSHARATCALMLGGAMIGWKQVAVDVQAMTSLHATAQAVLQACVRERLQARNEACMRLACACLLFEAAHLARLEGVLTSQLQSSAHSARSAAAAGAEQLQTCARDTEAGSTQLLHTALTLLESSPAPPSDMLACSAAHAISQLCAQPCLLVTLRASAQVCPHMRTWMQAHAHTLSPHVHSACMRAMMSLHVDAASQPAAQALQRTFPAADAGAASHMIALAQRTLAACVEAATTAADAVLSTPDVRAMARARAAARVCTRASGILAYMCTYAPECVCATAAEGARTHAVALLRVVQGCCEAACAGDGGIVAGVWADACHATFTLISALSHETSRSRPDLHALAASVAGACVQLIPLACERQHTRTAPAATAGFLYLLRCARTHIELPPADGHVTACVASLSSSFVMLLDETSSVAINLAGSIVRSLHASGGGLTPDCIRVVTAAAAVCSAEQLSPQTRSHALHVMLELIVADCFAGRDDVCEAVLMGLTSVTGALAEDVAYIMWAAAVRLPRARTSIMAFVYGLDAGTDAPFDDFVIACASRCCSSRR